MASKKVNSPRSYADNPGMMEREYPQPHSSTPDLMPATESAGVEVIENPPATFMTLPLQERTVQESLAALGERVTRVAHELNGPLTHVIGYSERLRRINPDAMESASRMMEYARKIELEAERALRVAKNLLLSIRPACMEKRLLSLNSLVGNTTALLIEETATAGVRLKLNLDKNDPKVVGDAHGLGQTLINLVTNALQAIQSSGVGSLVEVETFLTEDGEAVLQVNDDGPGIASEHLPLLLEPFFSTREAGQGTGLGLAICSTIWHDHGACLKVRSAPGKGASFQITFPVAPAAAIPARPSSSRIVLDTPEPIDKEMPELQAKSAHSEKLLSGARIAIVDDEPLVRELIEETLREAGCQVTCYDSPFALLPALHTVHFDLILSDVRMPGMNGMEFYARVLELRPHLASRILFLTGDALAPEIHAFLKRSQCPSLLKPFRMEELISSMVSLLHSKDSHERYPQAA